MLSLGYVTGEKKKKRKSVIKINFFQNYILFTIIILPLNITTHIHIHIFILLSIYTVLLYNVIWHIWWLLVPCDAQQISGQVGVNDIWAWWRKFAKEDKFSFTFRCDKWSSVVCGGLYFTCSQQYCKWSTLHDLSFTFITVINTNMFHMSQEQGKGLMCC